jgi:hypothetical protein
MSLEKVTARHNCGINEVPRQVITEREILRCTVCGQYWECIDEGQDDDSPLWVALGPFEELWLKLRLAWKVLRP